LLKEILIAANVFVRIKQLNPPQGNAAQHTMTDPNLKQEEATGAEVAEQAAEIQQPAPTAGEALENAEEGTTEG